MNVKCCDETEPRAPEGAEPLRLSFPEGLPAFESHKEFLLYPDEGSPCFLWLRSTLDGEPLSFVTVSPFSVVSDYVAEIRDPDAERIGITDPGDATLLAILNFSDYPDKVAVNLAGPVVVNRRTLQARQVTLENASRYGVHYMLPLVAAE